MRILCFSMEIRLVYSPCERCSLDSSTGFEVFVPGRQSMAMAMNPVFRSAHLIRHTVSHLFCRQHLWFFHVLRPNQSLQPTAGRSRASLEFMKAHPFQFTLAPASGG